MAAERSYDSLVEYYDWEHHAFLEDLPMYEAFAASIGGELLELACGSGRLLVPLAKSGHRITGVDASSGMLGEARRRVRAERVTRRTTLVQADMTSFDIDSRFGMAFVALGSFHHLLTVEQQVNCLRQIARHVDPGGLLVLDLINPAPEWLTAADGALVHQLTAPFPGPGGPDLLSKFVARSGDFATQTDEQLLVYELVQPSGATRRKVQQMSLRYLFRYEAALLLEKTGFRVRDIWGDYAMGRYDSSSPRLIMAAVRQ